MACCARLQSLTHNIGTHSLWAQWLSIKKALALASLAQLLAASVVNFWGCGIIPSLGLAWLDALEQLNHSPVWPATAAHKSAMAMQICLYAHL